MTDKTDRQLLEEMATDMTEVKIVLKGYNGQRGLCDNVEQHGKAITRIWVSLAVLTSSVGGGAFAIVKAFLGR